MSDGCDEPRRGFLEVGRRLGAGLRARPAAVRERAPRAEPAERGRRAGWDRLLAFARPGRRVLAAKGSRSINHRNNNSNKRQHE